MQNAVARKNNDNVSASSARFLSTNSMAETDRHSQASDRVIKNRRPKNSKFDDERVRREKDRVMKIISKSISMYGKDHLTMPLHKKRPRQVNH